jgi:hypothetical protein
LIFLLQYLRKSTLENIAPLDLRENLRPAKWFRDEFIRVRSIEIESRQILRMWKRKSGRSGAAKSDVWIARRRWASYATF